MTTNLNINAENAPSIFDVVCSECNFTGTATVEIPKISQLSVKETIQFTDNNGNIKCPSCMQGNIYAKSGIYKRNNDTGYMERIGDYEENE